MTEPVAHKKALPPWLVRTALAIVIIAQSFLAFLQIGDMWVRGHNGWNSSAYHNSARNALRWKMVFPVQYYTDNSPPPGQIQYTHHPLGMHLHDTVSFAIFGDHEWSLRLVPAVHAILAALMVFFFVRRFWGDPEAILASLIFVSLPINAIYTNMANHSSGFIFWGLLFFYAYLTFQERLERREPGRWRWFFCSLGAFTMAASWDWPAFYLAFAAAVHWLVTAIRRQRASGRSFFKPGPSFWSLVSFCFLVLTLFAGHFILVYAITGGTEELAGTFSHRQNIGWERFWANLSIVPELMFSYPLLLLMGGWLVFWIIRLFRGQTRPRDLVPVAFAFAGMLHYFIFRWSAIVHSYWAWTGLVFVAIAAGTSLLAICRWTSKMVSRWLPPRPALVTGVLVVSALMTPYLMRVVDLVPRGRRVGGALWFEYQVRGEHLQTYDSGRPALRFAEKVKQWTDRTTGVMIHRGFDPRQPEPRFHITLDRTVTYHNPRVSETGPTRPGITGWVFIAPVKSVPQRRRRELARRHPYWQWGEFFMLDLRSRKADVRVYELQVQEPSLAYWYFVSPFEAPVQAHRSPEQEEALKGPPMRSGPVPLGRGQVSPTDAPTGAVGRPRH